MTYSLNEVEVEVKKAVRGAGLPWGLAEEGAKAARWLASFDTDPLPPLLDVLDRRASGKNIATMMTQAQSGRWQATAPICPILLGAALCDRAQEVALCGFAASVVARPLLVVPFVARTARALRRPLRLRVSAFEIGLSADGEPTSDLSAFDLPEATDLRCDAASCESAPVSRHRRMTAGRIDPSGWSRLSAYAQRTYVPATERSRREGAGAGMIDND